MKRVILSLLAGLNTLTLSAQTQTLQYYPGLSRYDIAVDANDTIWTGSRDSGLVRIYNSVAKTYFPGNSGIADKRCYVVSIDSSGRIWAGGDSGVSIFDKTNWITLDSVNSSLPANRITAFCQTSTGCWIGTNYGISFYDGNNWITYNTANSNLISNFITSVSTNGTTVYIGTNAGISVMTGSAWTNYPCSQNGLVDAPIKKVLYAGGRLWASNLSSVVYQEQGAFNSLASLYFGSFGTNILFFSRALCHDETGNVYVTNYNSFNAILQIQPNLHINLYKLSVGSQPFAPSACIRNNYYYSISQLTNSGYFKANLDTSLTTPIVYFSGSPNEFLNVNKSFVRLLNRGDMHWDPITQQPEYFVPLNPHRTPVYCSALWLGGIDQGGQLHAAAMTYRQMNSVDFWPGPLDTITGTTDSATSAWFDRFWKIDFDMIQSFQINYQNGNLQNGSYILPEAIATWPAHGNNNYSRNLAPFIDINGDGNYNPYDGDYPELTGHQMLWWVFNDTMSNMHTETGGKAFQFEIQGKAYGFNCNNNTSVDEVMDYTTFYQYTITNRSQNTYSNSYIGLWTDLDLGNAADDYIGCDTMLNTFYCYNGDNDDDGGGGYGLNPPMMNVTFLKGPAAALNDNLDNNHNGIIDETNETSGMNGFMYYRNVNNVPDGNPYNATGYYNYLKSLWQDGQPLTDSTGTPIKFTFPGTPYTNGNSMGNTGLLPDDMRGVGSSGPFTIAPGESQTIDFAYIYTRDSLNPNGITTSIAKNTADVQKIINGLNSGTYPCLTTVGLPSLANKNLDFQLYPNPVSNTLYFNKEMLGAEYEIYSVTGQLVKSGLMTGSGISTEQLQSQLYIIRAVKQDNQYVKRFVKM